MGASRKLVQSVSLPCRLHPKIDKMEKLLNKVKSWESSSNPSAETICSGFSHLTALYECLEDLLNTNHTMEWTDELLDISVRFLDVCNNTTEVISQTKQHLRHLGCDLRRNGGCGTASTIPKYIEFRKKLKRDIKGSMGNLKQVDKTIRGCPLIENYHLVRVFKEVISFNIVIFRAFIEFLVIPRRKETRRWIVVSRFTTNAKVVPEGKLDNTCVNELQRLDAELLRYCSGKKKELLQNLPKNLEALEATLEGIDSHLHLLSRRLIVTRVSILNMVSFH